MTDPGTNQPIRVSDQDKERLDITVSAQHLDRVSALLEANNVRIWVAHRQVSVNGSPYMAYIHLRRWTDARQVQVQAIFDAAA